MKITAGLWIAIMFITFMTGGFLPMLVIGALSAGAIMAADHAGTQRNSLSSGSKRRELY